MKRFKPKGVNSGMVDHVRGAYVRHDAYVALETKLEALKAEVNRTLILYEDHITLIGTLPFKKEHRPLITELLAN